MKNCFLLFSLLLSFTGRACYNEFVHDSTGETHIHGDFSLLEYKRNFNFSDLDAKIAKKEKQGLKTYKDSSDYCVLLAKRGYVFKALNILRVLGKAHPNDYTVAANLGTTYELSGKNDSALLWIKKGIQINPASHQGSEWVHVKILEAKIAMQQDKDWLKSHAVLGLDGQAAIGPTPTKEEPFTKFSDKEKQVMYQLDERLPFMAPPDELMAAVFRELAYYQENASVEAAINHYRYALEYADGKDKKSKDKIAELTKLLKSKELRPHHHGMGDNIPPLVPVAFDTSAAYKVLDMPAPVIAAKRDTIPQNDSAATLKETKTGKGADESSGPSFLFWMVPVLMAGVVSVWLWMRRRKAN